MSKKTTSTPLETPAAKLQRRKRTPVVSFYLEPQQDEWKLKSKEWEVIEDECILELNDGARQSIEEAINEYFYNRDIELAAIKLNDVQKYLMQVKATAVTLHELLVGKHSDNAALASRDVLAEAFFDPLDPRFNPETYCKGDGDPFDAAMAEMIISNPCSDMAVSLQRLIEETSSLLEQNSREGSHVPASRKDAWYELVRCVAIILSNNNVPIGIKDDTSKGASMFTLLLLELTRRWPERFRQHILGQNGSESSDAMARAMSRAMGEWGEAQRNQ